MVPESERSACRFDVLLKANKLASYTINICSNENVFLPQYKTSITDDLIKTAKDIYINCYAANEYKPNRSLPEIKSRLSLQTHALIECVLGFTHKLTETGKVIRLINPQNVKNERKKLARLVNKAKRGEITKEKVNQCYESWKAHARKGNTYKLLCRMDIYYKQLWK